MIVTVVIIRTSAMLHNYAPVFRQITIVFYYWTKTYHHHHYQELPTYNYL